MNRIKRFIISIILWILVRALNVLEARDASVAEDLAGIAEGMCVRFRTGLTGTEPSCTIVRQDGRLKRVRSDQHADIEITFKSLSGAFRVFVGAKSMGQAYCEHRFVLAVNINETMCLVRAIETAEGYLFPRFWNKRILKHKVDKQLPTVAVYALAVAGR